MRAWACVLALWSASLPGLARAQSGWAASGPGFFAVPKPLAKDPAKLKIPPLAFSVVKPERTQLPNGLTVYLVQDPTIPLVDVRAMFFAGTVDEPAAKLGLAELTFELLSSSGAGSLSSEALDELFERHGADVGGGAGDEYSTLDINVASSDLPKLFPAFVDMVRRPRFEPARFRVAVERLEEGIRRRPDSVDGLAMRAVRKAVFGADSLFGRESTLATVKAITVDDVRKFHQRLATPRGSAILVTGDFDRDAVLKLITEQMGDWTGGERLPRSYPPPAPLKRHVWFIPKDTAQAKIRIAHFGYRRLAPQEYAMRLMGTALGDFGVGRLFKEIRDTRGLAYSAYANVSPGPSSGLFYAAADTKPQTAVEALEAMLQVLKGISGPKPVSRAELGIAGDMFLNSFAFRFDSPEKVAREKAVYDFFGYPEGYLDTFRANVSKVTPAQVTEAAVLAAPPDALQLVVVGPAKEVGGLEQFGPVTVIHDVETFR